MVCAKSQWKYITNKKINPPKWKKNLTLAFFSPFYLISSSLRNLLSPSVNISFFTSGSIQTVLQFRSCNMYQRIPYVVSNCFWLVIFFCLFLQFFCVNILPFSGFALEALFTPFFLFHFLFLSLASWYYQKKWRLWTLRSCILFQRKLTSDWNLVRGKEIKNCWIN